MEHLTSTEPIIACSSGSTVNSAVSLIRISGINDFSFINHLFSIDLNDLRPRYAHYCNLLFDGKVVDQIVITYFKGPNSYNGENILELGVHGNLLNIERIINIFNNHNIRTAGPGEFTYRALRNKKLTMSQVEGLDLLLNANSIFSLDQGFSLMSGKFQKSYLNLHQCFLNHKSAVELSIDFYEDVGEEQATSQFNETFKAFSDAIYSLKKHISNEGINLLKPEIVLIGLPNAGKSSLFNLLLAENRSIVSTIEGTTRDYISEQIKINNVIFSLIDTAGIRSSSDEIESEGIKRSLDLASSSFYKVLVINPFNQNFEYYKNLKDIDLDLIVFSHKDMYGFDKALSANVKRISRILGVELYDVGPIEPVNSGPMGAIDDGPIEPKSGGPMGAKDDGPIEPKRLLYLSLALNSVQNDDIERIESIFFLKYNNITSKEPILLDRHKELVNKIYLLVKEYHQLTKNIQDISIISSELNSVGHCISELIGIISPDDVLHNIFDNFCIGK